MRVGRAGTVLAALLCVGACGGSGDSGAGASPTSPTAATPAPLPAGTGATPVGQTGCSATYACPNVDADGNANPSTPTFDRVTLGNGTSATCPVERLPDGTGAGPIPTFPVEFSIRNPSPQFLWRSNSGSSAFLQEPPSGSAGSSGPFQATARIAGPQGSLAGQIASDILTLEIRRFNDMNIVVARCAMTVWFLQRPTIR